MRHAVVIIAAASIAGPAFAQYSGVGGPRRQLPEQRERIGKMEMQVAEQTALLRQLLGEKTDGAAKGAPASASIRHTSGGLTAYVGKFPQFLSRTDMILDGDVSAQAAGRTYSRSVGLAKRDGRALYRFIDEAAEGRDSDMVGGLLVGTGQLTSALRVSLAGGYYRSRLGSVVGADAGDFRSKREAGGCYVSGFHLVDGIATLGWRGASPRWPVNFVFNYGKNPGAAVPTESGFNAKVAVGRAAEPGDWRLAYNYSEVEVDTIFAAFSRDNLSYATKYRPHGVGLSYVPSEDVVLDAAFYHYRPLQALYAGDDQPREWPDGVRPNLVSFRATADAARGQNMPAPEHGDPDIVEPSPPLTLDVAYTADLVRNAAGGLRRGTVYLDNFDAVLDADLDPLVGWRGAKARAYALYNNGASISALVGDAQSVANIEAGSHGLRLYEAWIEQEIAPSASLLVGLYDLNSEFDALEASSLFVGSAHGIGTDFSQSGQNGPSIFPVTSLTARLEVEPADGWAARAAVLDAVPGDPARPRRTTIRFDRGDGALLVGEVEATAGGGRLLIGHWRYTAPFEALDGERGRGNLGFYLRGEAPLVSAAGRTVHGFFRLGTASGRYNVFDRFASGGLTLNGLVRGRSEDEFGIAVAAALTSERYRRLSGALRSEIAIEATYRAGLTPWLTVQPHAQYVVQPSADPTIRDAFVVGFRTEFAFRLFGS